MQDMRAELLDLPNELLLAIAQDATTLRLPGAVDACANMHGLVTLVRLRLVCHRLYALVDPLGPPLAAIPDEVLPMTWRSWYHVPWMVRGVAAAGVRDPRFESVEHLQQPIANHVNDAPRPSPAAFAKWTIIYKEWGCPEYKPDKVGYKGKRYGWFTYAPWVLSGRLAMKQQRPFPGQHVFQAFLDRKMRLGAEWEVELEYLNHLALAADRPGLIVDVLPDESYKKFWARIIMAGAIEHAKFYTQPEHASDEASFLNMHPIQFIGRGVKFVAKMTERLAAMVIAKPAPTHRQGMAFFCFQSALLGLLVPSLRKRPRNPAEDAADVPRLPPALR
jgi:hypothetical protein